MENINGKWTGLGGGEREKKKQNWRKTKKQA